jgi:hypothetical protein
VVTGCYQVHPGVSKKNISTQYSTWMEMEVGSGTAVALEDCGGTAVLGGDAGWWFKIAVTVLGGSGSRRTCDNGVGTSIVEAEGLYYNIGISIGKEGKKGCVRCKGRTLAVMAMR